MILYRVAGLELFLNNLATFKGLLVCRRVVDFSGEGRE